jgi:hypothetical protein
MRPPCLCEDDIQTKAQTTDKIMNTNYHNDCLRQLANNPVSMAICQEPIVFVPAEKWVSG